MFSKHRLAVAVLAIAPTFLLAGGLSAQESLVFAWTPNPQTPQVDVALAEGYFEEAGLDVEIVSFATGREGFEALLGGQVDITFMAEFPAAVGILQEQDFGIIADLARYRGSRIIGNASATELGSPAALDGLTIGTTLGTNVDFFLSQVLQNAGAEAEIVNAAPGDLIPALARGDVDAAVTFPTFYGAAAQALGDDYRELRAQDYSPHFILAASGSMLKERSDVVDAFIGALAKADADVASDPATAQDAVLENLGGAMPKEALVAMWEDVELGLVLNQELLDLLHAEAAWIVERGVINAEAPDEKTVRAAFAEGHLAKAKPDAIELP